MYRWQDQNEQENNRGQADESPSEKIRAEDDESGKKLLDVRSKMTTYGKPGKSPDPIVKGSSPNCQRKNRL